MKLKAWVRGLVNFGFPHGSRRRVLLHRVRTKLFRTKQRKLANPWDIKSLQSFLKPLKLQLTSQSPSAIFRLLHLFVSTPGLHGRFPRALSGQDDFADWIRQNVTDPTEVEAFLNILKDRPSKKVLHIYDHAPHWSAVFPLGLTSAGRATFTYWLLEKQKHESIGPDEALWFLLENAEDPAEGLAESYRRQPEWQTAVEDGLNPENWEKLKTWLRQKYKLASGTFRQAQCPEYHPPATMGVNVMGHLRYPSGLQVAALNTIEALESQSLALSVRDVPTGIPTDIPGRDGLLGLHPYPVTISQLAPEPLTENCYPFCGLAMREGTHRIGYWYWELEDVPDGWQKHEGWLHELWAPTKFIGQALRKKMPMPVYDMLAGMRMPPVVHRDRAHFGLPKDHFLFLFVFDMCSTFERKNPLAAIESFRRAFKKSQPVSLAIKISRGYHDPENLKKLQDVCEKEGIHLIDQLLPHDDLHGLMNTCDAYVSLHRSEGYGLTLAEAMALGKPTIATAYSGNLDFMTAENSFLVRWDRVELQQTIHVYPKGCTWAEPDTKHAAELMKQIVEDRMKSIAVAQRGQQEVRQTLSISAAGERMAKRLAELGVKPVSPTNV